MKTSHRVRVGKWSSWATANRSVRSSDLSQRFIQLSIANSLCFVVLLTFLISSVFSAAQPSEAPNGVLELPSEGSFVELPADAFKDHSVVTVEGWVKWGQFKRNSRFFDFAVGDLAFDVKNDVDSPTIALERVHSDRVYRGKTQNALEVGVWTHIVAVCSPDMTTLYINGY